MLYNTYQDWIKHVRPLDYCHDTKTYQSIPNKDDHQHQLELS